MRAARSHFGEVTLRFVVVYAPLMAVGAPAAVLARTAVDAGMDAGTVRHVATSAAAADLVAGLIEHGDVVLVKGSRGVRTDLVVDRLVAELG